MPISNRRKATDAELAKITQNAIRNAIEFTATIRAAHPDTGLMQNFTLRRSSLAEARSVASKLETGFVNGRKALVYAVDANGMSFLIPENFASMTD